MVASCNLIPISDWSCVPVKPIAILADPFGGTAINTELNHRNLFLGFRLLENIRVPEPIIASDAGRSMLAAQIAVGALSVNVEFPWNIQGIAILELGHSL